MGYMREAPVITYAGPTSATGKQSESRTVKERAWTAADDRPGILEARRNVKMARSAYAYVRGNTAEFYE
jgi:hypothetical protein